MSVPEKILKGISDVLATVACIMIAGMMLLAVTDVVLRIVFGSPIIGATEIIQILNVGIVVALGAGTIRNQHVTVDFIMDKIPKVPRFYIQMAADILNAFILALLSYCSVQMMIRSRAQGYTYSLLRIPEWPFVGLIALGLLGGVLAMIFVMCQRIRVRVREAGETKHAQEETAVCERGAAEREGGDAHE